MKKYILILLSFIVFSCSNQVKKKSNEWINLFDGKSLEGWRAYNGEKCHQDGKLLIVL